MILFYLFFPFEGVAWEICGIVREFSVFFPTVF